MTEEKVIMATITPKELAVRLESDGKTVRKFLRSITPKDEQPGKGNRWAIDSKRVTSLKKEFATWDEKRKAEIAARRAEKLAQDEASDESDDQDEVLEDDADA